MLNPTRVPAALQEHAEPSPDLAPAHLLARAAFDLEAALAGLPKFSRPAHIDATGNAGQRLNGALQATIADDLLREFARDTLRAQRCSDDYLKALRVVLGNQGRAERRGYVLEMNRRVAFASERTMRTILDQMKAARIGYARAVVLGSQRRQTVRCFGRARPDCTPAMAQSELLRMYRESESEVDGPVDELPDLSEAVVPY